MSSFRHDPPSRDLLALFLREQRALRVRELAPILGWTAAGVRRRAKEDGVLRSDGTVRWRDAAGWLLESWPLVTLFETLGPDAGLLPPGLAPVPLLLQQPGYLVHALRTQWSLEPMPHRAVRPATFDEYLTDILHRAIDPSTVAALRDDAEFMAAYDFPGGEDVDDHAQGTHEA
jgi:hypothetical protein